MFLGVFGPANSAGVCGGLAIFPVLVVVEVEDVSVRREVGEESVDDEDEDDGGEQIALSHEEHYGNQVDK